MIGRAAWIERGLRAIPSQHFRAMDVLECCVVLKDGDGVQGEHVLQARIGFSWDEGVEDLQVPVGSPEEVDDLHGGAFPDVIYVGLV